MLRKPALRTLLIALGGLLVIVLGYWLLTLLGLDANAISAVATAVAAIAAFASASSSSTAARESVRALSYATKPTLSLAAYPEQDGSMRVSVVNDSLQHAADVVLRWQLRDGRTGQTNIGDIRADSLQQEGLTIGHRGPASTVTMEPDPGQVSGTDHLEIEYGGKLGVTRWISKWEVEVTYERRDGVSSFGRRTLPKGEEELRRGLA